MKHRILNCCGYLAPLPFGITLFVSGMMRDEYSHIHNIVSELGRAGTVSENVFNTGLIITAGFGMLFLIGITGQVRKRRQNQIPVILLFTIPFSMFFAGIFPLPHHLHGILGSPSIIAPLSPLAAIFLWKAGHSKWLIFIIFCIMMLGFLVFLPDNSLIGLKQRIFHLGWSVWFIFLAYIYRGEANV